MEVDVVMQGRVKQGVQEEAVAVPADVDMAPASPSHSPSPSSPSSSMDQPDEQPGAAGAGAVVVGQFGVVAARMIEPQVSLQDQIRAWEDQFKDLDAIDTACVLGASKVPAAPVVVPQSAAPPVPPQAPSAPPAPAAVVPAPPLPAQPAVPPPPATAPPPPAPEEAAAPAPPAPPAPVSEPVPPPPAEPPVDRQGKAGRRPGWGAAQVGFVSDTDADTLHVAPAAAPAAVPAPVVRGQQVGGAGSARTAGRKTFSIEMPTQLSPSKQQGKADEQQATPPATPPAAKAPPATPAAAQAAPGGGAGGWVAAGVAGATAVQENKGSDGGDVVAADGAGAAGVGTRVAPGWHEVREEEEEQQPGRQAAEAAVSGSSDSRGGSQSDDDDDDRDEEGGEGGESPAREARASKSSKKDKKDKKRKKEKKDKKDKKEKKSSKKRKRSKHERASDSEDDSQLAEHGRDEQYPSKQYPPRYNNNPNYHYNNYNRYNNGYNHRYNNNRYSNGGQYDRNYHYNKSGEWEDRGRPSSRRQGGGSPARSDGSRSRSRSRSRGRSGSRSASPQQRYYNRGGRGRGRGYYNNHGGGGWVRARDDSRSRSRSPRHDKYAGGRSSRGGDRSPGEKEGRTREEEAAALARAAEAARLASLASGFAKPMMHGGSANLPANPQVTRHARRVYVGGLPNGTTDVGLSTFFDHAMQVTGASVMAGPCVTSVYLNMDKKYAFLELRSVEEASNAMALDGLTFRGESLKVRRPHDYNPEAARAFGPTEPHPRVNVHALGVVGTMVEDGPNKIFVGGLPHYLTEDQVRELLGAFGTLKSYNLVTDKETGISKGFAFCEYLDPAMTESAIPALNAIMIGGRPITARRSTNAAQHSVSRPTGSAVLTQTQQSLVHQAQAALAASLGMPAPAPFQPSAAPTTPPAAPAAPSPLARVSSAGGSAPAVAQQQQQQQQGGGGGDVVVRLEGMVMREELIEEEDYQGLLEDTTEEVTKYGTLTKVTIPRPHPQDPAQDPPGVGRVYLRYEDPRAAERACLALNGRKFGDAVVKASTFSTADFEAGRLT